MRNMRKMMRSSVVSPKQYNTHSRISLEIYTKGELWYKNELFSCKRPNIFQVISCSCYVKLCKRVQNFYVVVSLKFD